jgi:hypothetical protein
MIARFVLPLLLGACTAVGPLAAPERADLERAVEPYASRMRAVGITRVVTQHDSAMVRLDTLSGAVYTAYPGGMPRLDRTIEVEASRVRAAAASFDPNRDSRAVTTVLAQAIDRAASNNAVQWIRANPWH